MTRAKDGLSNLENQIKKDFETNRRVLTFDEYLALLAEKPRTQLRGSAKYALDMMDYFGKSPAKNPDDPAAPPNLERFHVFDIAGADARRKVVGHVQVQTQIYRTFQKFHRQKINNKLILLHGPNGSAKTSLVHSLMEGLERYSHTPEGALYSFNWIFPVERYTKGGIGLSATYASSNKESVKSYAKLLDEEIAAKIPSDLKDHPLLLIPRENRFEFLKNLLGEAAANEVWSELPLHITHGDLCQRSKEIFEALLTANGGDLKKVLMHVQVERIFLSRRYRKSLVTIEPQMHVDAQYQQLTMNKNIANLPVSLQSLSLFQASGDLVDGNRGLLEFSDLLKRPVDTFKYLLGVCETGSVNVGPAIVSLDMLMVGSTNEIQLDAFKEFPDFASFKARIELIRVPYLLQVSEEAKIYEQELEGLAEEKPIAPHTAWSLALWSVLSRLKKPNSINYPPSISTLISNLTPLEKAKLYDTGELPHGLSPDDRKLLRSSIKKLREEYSTVPYYEGRLGASAREMKSVLYDSAQNPEFSCISPIAILREMEEFIKRVSEYEFLKQDVKDGYHDAAGFILTVRNEYLNRIDREVRDCIGLYDSAQWEEFMKKYVQHLSLIMKKEKYKNPMNGKLEDPDHSLVAEFEKIVEAPTSDEALVTFRQNILSQIGAWVLDHPKEGVVYGKVFPDFWRKIEKFYYETQKGLLTKMHGALLLFGTEAEKNTSDEGRKLAQTTISNMIKKYHYDETSAKEVLTFLMSQRY